MTNLRDLIAQRNALDKQIEELKNVELNLAITQVRQLVADWNLTPEDCGFKIRSVSTGKRTKLASTVVAQYRGPNGVSWSGRGRPPVWLVKLESEGRQRSEFLVA